MIWQALKCRLSFVFCLAAMLAGLSLPAWANKEGVAVIIGNKAYGEKVPEVSFAHRDADAFRAYVRDILGFREENIIDLRDASQAEMLAAFGSERSHQGKLWSYLDPKGGSDVVIFYSGHGVPGVRDGRGYLLPADADPNLAEINGYPLDLLYQNLQKLKAKSVTVYLDACFSGDSSGGMLIRAASPGLMQVAVPEETEGLTILTAASGTQLASWDEDAEHGLFTGYLMKALYGAADADGNGDITAHEVKEYLDGDMTRAARRRYLRDQVASLSGDVGRVLSSAPKQGIQQPVVGGSATPVGPLAAIPENGIMYVGPDHLNLRGGPGTIHSKLDTLAPGTELRVLNRSGQTGWLHVALADGRKGYVFDQFLRAEDPVKPASQIVESVEEDVVSTEIVTRPAQPEWEMNQPEEDFWLPPGLNAPPPGQIRPRKPKPKVVIGSRPNPVARNPVPIGEITRIDFSRGGVIVALRDKLRMRPLRPHEELVVMTREGDFYRLNVVRVSKSKILARVAGDLSELSPGMRVFLKR